MINVSQSTERYGMYACVVHVSFRQHAFTYRVMSHVYTHILFSVSGRPPEQQSADMGAERGVLSALLLLLCLLIRLSVMVGALVLLLVLALVICYH